MTCSNTYKKAPALRTGWGFLLLQVVTYKKRPLRTIPRGRISRAYCKDTGYLTLTVSGHFSSSKKCRSTKNRFLPHKSCFIRRPDGYDVTPACLATTIQPLLFMNMILVLLFRIFLNLHNVIYKVPSIDWCKV
jgi:hypothetical protein